MISKDALKSKGYPGEPGHDFYLIFDVKPAGEFDGYAWDYSKLPHKAEGRLSGWPYAVTLLTLMATIAKTTESAIMNQMKKISSSI